MPTFEIISAHQAAAFLEFSERSVATMTGDLLVTQLATPEGEKVLVQGSGDIFLLFS